MADLSNNPLYKALQERTPQKPQASGPDVAGSVPPDYNPLRLSAASKDAEAAWRQSQQNMEASRSLIDRAAGTAQAALAGAEQGVVGTAGLPADLSNLIRVYGPAVGSVMWNAINGNLFTSHDPQGDAAKYFTETAAREQAKLTPEEQAGKTGNVLGINWPTGESMVQGAKEAAPWTGIAYEPRNDWERGVMDVSKYTGYGLAGLPLGGATGFIGGGLKGAALEGALAGTRAAAGEILPLTAAGITHQGGKAATEALGLKGVPAAVIETMSDIPGYMMGKLLTKGPKAGEIVTEKLVNPMIGSQISNPSRVRNAVDAALMQDYYGNLRPRSTDIIPELRPLQAEVQRFADMANHPLQPVGVEARSAAQTRAEELRNMGLELGSKIEEAIPALPERAPVRDTIDSASSAADKFQQSVEAVEAREKQLWANPALQAAQYDAYPSLQAFNNVDGSIRDTLQDVEAFMNNKLSNGTLSGPDLKLIRSDIGAKLASAPSGSIAQSEYKKLYDALSDNLFDPTNLTPQSMQNINASGASEAYREAVAATRAKHEVFGDPNTVLGKLATRDNSGAFRSPQDFMDALFSSKGDINTNLRDLRRAGINIDEEIKDYVLGNLVDPTKASITRLDEAKLNRFLADDRNRILVDRVPGLKDEIDALRSMTVRDRFGAELSSTMDKLAGKPQELFNFIDKNRDELDQHFQMPEQQQMLDAMQKSAKLFKDAKSGAMKPNDPRLVEALKSQPIFSLLYGRLAEVPMTFLAMVPSLGASVWNAAQLKMAPAFDRLVHPQKMLDRVFSASREEAGRALLEILNDPNKAAALAGELTPKKINYFLELLGDTTSAGAKVGAMGYIDQQEYVPEKPPVPDFYDQARRAAWENYYRQHPEERPAEGSYFKGGRIARQSGGRVGSPGSAADKLIAAAEKAKNRHSDDTSPLLDVPDEAITKALAIANEKI